MNPVAFVLLDIALLASPIFLWWTAANWLKSGMIKGYQMETTRVGNPFRFWKNVAMFGCSGLLFFAIGAIILLEILAYGVDNVAR